MSDLDQEIGKRLRKARKLRGYKSARSFANEFGIPESTYSQHETGKRSLSPETVLGYCDKLGIEPGWLLCGGEASVRFSVSDDDTVTIVDEVSLNTSNRQVGSQDVSKKMMDVPDNLMTMNLEIFKVVLKKAMRAIFSAEVSENKIEQLLEFCEKNYGMIEVATDFQVKEGDTVASE